MIVAGMIKRRRKGRLSLFVSRGKTKTYIVIRNYGGIKYGIKQDKNSKERDNQNSSNKWATGEQI